MRLFLSLFFLLLTLGNAFGQEDDTVKLKEVVITGSRLPQGPKETGRNISVLNSEVIANLPVRSLDELLRYIPGVEAQSRNSFGTQSDIIIRGSTFQQVLILIDGIRLNDPLTGHFNGYIPITPAEIDRIEVLRGPAASMFGAEAVGGVVHIITKTFSQEQSVETAANAEITLGENKLISSQVGLFKNKDRLRFGLGASSNSSEGHDLPTGEKADFQIQTASGSIGYRLNDSWEILSRVGYDFRDYNAQYFYTRSPFDKARETTSNIWTQLKLRNNTGKGLTDFDIAFKQTGDKYVFSPDFPSTNEHTTQYFTFQINRQQTINKEIGLAYGIQADRRSIESTDRGDHNDTHLAAYGVLNYNLESFNINGSLRIDYDQNYDLEFNPQINTSYVFDKWVIRGAVGRSIRAADYTERYISTNIPAPLTPGRNLGNPDLRAESSWNFETGIDYFPANGLKFIATGFLRKSSDLIDFVIVNESEITNNGNLVPGENYFWAKNIQDVNTSGIELESWYQQRINNSLDVFFNVGYTFLNTANPGGEVSKYISNHARHLVTSNIVLSKRKWNISINGLYKVREADLSTEINSALIPDYMVWNTRMGYELFYGIALNFEVHNIFNEDYSDVLGAKMPGRWIMGGISWSLLKK